MREDLHERRAKSMKDEERKSSGYLDALYPNTLKRLYIQILRFQANVIKDLSKNGAFGLGLDMIKWSDGDLSGVQKQEAEFCKVYDIMKDLNSERDFEKILAHHREQIENLSSISYGSASLLDAIQKEQADGELTALLNWLSSVDSSRLYNSGLNKIHPGTGEWLLSGNSTFEKWQDSPNSFIWLHGKAGSGKSVLSSSIIHHLEGRYKAAPNIATAFFYFRFDDSKTQTVDEMLCSLIKQICAQRPITPHSVQSLDKHKMKGHRPDRTTLESALVASVQGFDAVYIVVDALDECPLQNTEREQLLKTITRIRNQNFHNLHLLCTSRREPDIERALKVTLFSDFVFDIDLTATKEAVDRDILFYIDETFRSDEPFSSWPEKWKIDVRGALIEKADGMFQYVALQLKELKHHRTKATIQGALRDLPKDLDGIYNRILENIHPEYRKQVASTLKWLAFSRDPLYVEQVAEIFILDHEETVPFDEESRFDPVQDVLVYLSGLVAQIPVAIRDFGQPPHSPVKRKTTEIKFAHFSIKEYLSSWGLHEAQACFSTSEQASHLHISESSLAYHLQLSKTILATEETAKIYALWQYAATNWAFHLEKVQRESWTISATDRVNCVLQARSQALLNMARLSKPERNGSPDFEMSLETVAAPLYYICYQGATQLASLLIEQGAEVNEISPHADYGTALQAAADQGHDGIVSLLMEHGADINLIAGAHGSALEAAASSGHIKTAMLLLDHGADINTKAENYGGALVSAAYGGHIEVLQLLLDRGADIHASRGYHGSALATAAYAQRTELLRLLLDRGANVNAEYGNVLEIAAYSGSIETVQLLLDRGANVNARGNFGSALAAAAAHASGTELVQILLDRGANLNTKGGLYGNALQAAIACGAVDSAELLLSQGAEIHPSGEEWEELLEKLEEKGHRDEVLNLREFTKNPEGFIERKRQDIKEKEKEEEKLRKGSQG